MRPSVFVQGISTDPPVTRPSLEHRDEPRDEPRESGAGIQPEVSSRRDDFTYRVPKVSRYTGSGIYWWPNSGIAAHVQQASAVGSGRMRIVIRDANGAEVFARSLAEGGGFLTQNGATGRWSIQVVYDDASGTVSFRVRRKG